MLRLLNNKVLLTIVGILLLANITMLFFFVWLKEPEKRKHRERQPSPMAVFLEKEVGFSKAQMNEFDKLRQQHKSKIRVLFEETRLTKIGFYQLLSESSPDSSVLNHKASAIGDRQKAMDLQAFRHFKEIGAICTAEQKPKYDSLVSRVVSKMWFSPRRENDRQR